MTLLRTGYQVRYRRYSATKLSFMRLSLEREGEGKMHAGESGGVWREGETKGRDG